MRVQVLAFLLPVLALAGCGSPVAPSNGPASPEGKLRVAVIPKGTTHEFWKSVNAGAQEAGNEFGVEVIWKGPLKEDDREEQIKVVENFITQKVDGIVLAPLDDTALRLPVDTAQKSGIPVLIFDSALKDVETVSFVATDSFRGGQIAGERMAELLGGSGRVIVLRYQEGSASTTQREEGFLKAAQEAGLKVVSSNQYAGATVETAQRASENLLSRFRKADGLDLEGIFCPNESSTFGMLRALQGASLAGKVRFVGFDASPKLVAALEAGEIDGLVLQDPHKMGYLAVKTLVSHLRGEQVEKRIDTGAVLATKENRSEPDIAKLLAPPQS
ncbi:MAG: sugar ABC transporter substrate-binding protein [Chthonomonadaceae bacterium]|uniref:Sugar ABC transporter substrate-binding protein n=1 Tax=Candidatus Nitrosymbiomonas proteolyticus TaxID=2608984 RepID=A0A809R6F7_9BACT|nr:sugar ABC transporter substrate-binding protein [Candidatus Nitrosymbiomonas proteolyticus]